MWAVNLSGKDGFCRSYNGKVYQCSELVAFDMPTKFNRKTK